LLCISVLIYTYDRRDYLIKAVTTVLEQKPGSYKSEIIVIKGFVDEKIDNWLQERGVKSIYLNEKSLGKKIARGIRESQGDVISFLDDDDEFEPNKLTTIFKLFSGDPELDFVHNSLSKITDSGDIIDAKPKENPAENLCYLTSSNNYSLLSKILRYRGDWYLSCISIRRSVLLNVLDSLDETDQSLDKFIFFAVLNHGKKMMMISDTLTKYRLHQSTTTYIGRKSEFILKREIFFQNTLRVFDSIVKLSANLPGGPLAKCQLIQHKINLYLISDEACSQVSMHEFVQFLSCLKITHSRYQLVWICAFLMRRVSPGLSRFLYYNFFKIAFKNAATA